MAALLVLIGASQWATELDAPSAAFYTGAYWGPPPDHEQIKIAITAIDALTDATKLYTKMFSYNLGSRRDKEIVAYEGYLLERNAETQVKQLSKRDVSELEKERTVHLETFATQLPIVRREIRRLHPEKLAQEYLQIRQDVLSQKTTPAASQ